MIRPVRGRPVFALDKVAPDTDDSVSKLQTGPERRRAYLKSDGKGGGLGPLGGLWSYMASMQLQLLTNMLYSIFGCLVPCLSEFQ